MKKCVRLLTVIVSLVFVCAFISCGGSSSDTNQTLDTNSTATEETNENKASEESIVEIKDGVELEWDTGKAVLTGYSIYESTTIDNEGDTLLTLYFDFTNPDGEPQTMQNNLQVDVFQNGITLDYDYYLDTPEEINATKMLQQGASLTCATTFILPDTESPLTIMVHAWNKDYEEVTAEQEIVIKGSFSGSNTKLGSDDSLDNPDESFVKVKDGVELEWDTGKAVLTGYCIYESTTIDNEGDTLLTLYFDFTNPDSEPQTMLNNLQVDVFQNGVTLDYDPYSDTSEEINTGKMLQQGASLRCARTFVLPDTENPLTILVRAWNKDHEEVKAEQELLIK